MTTKITNIKTYISKKVNSLLLFCRCYSKNTENNVVSIPQDIEWKDTIPFVAPINQGRCIKVYDGDTITIAAKLPYKNSPIYRFSVRLNGIDTPEIKGKDDDEKQCAVLARDALKQCIIGKKVELRNVQTEKYGRILAEVYCDNINLNEWMVKQRFAVKYDGGTKVSPNSWMEYHTLNRI